MEAKEACWQAGASCANCNLTLAGHPDNLTIAFPPAVSGLLGASCIIFSLLGSAANGILLVSIILTRQERVKITTPFILSLCLADLLFSMLLLPIQATRFLSQDWRSSLGSEDGVLCQTFPVMLYTVLGARLLSLMCVTATQAVNLFFEKMENKFERQYSFLLVVLCWLLPLACLLPSQTQSYGKVVLKEYTQTCTIVDLNFPEESGSDPKNLLYFGFFIPAATILAISNVSMFIKIQTLNKGLSRQMSSRKDGGATLNEKRKNLNVFIFMLFLSFAFWLLSILPFLVVDQVVDSCFQKPDLHAAAYILNFTKVVANPAIFILSQRGFYQAVKNLPNIILCRGPKEAAVSPKSILSSDFQTSGTNLGTTPANSGTN